MLDTNICSFIMRENPKSVKEKLDKARADGISIVISAITYAEMMMGSIGKKAPAKLPVQIASFVERLDGILPWSRVAIEESVTIARNLSAGGEQIGINDTYIAGHAIAENCVLITNNTREFSRVKGLTLEDWVTH